MISSHINYDYTQLLRTKYFDLLSLTAATTARDDHAYLQVTLTSDEDLNFDLAGDMAMLEGSGTVLSPRSAQIEPELVTAFTSDSENIFTLRAEVLTPIPNLSLTVAPTTDWRCSIPEYVGGLVIPAAVKAKIHTLATVNTGVETDYTLADWPNLRNLTIYGNYGSNTVVWDSSTALTITGLNLDTLTISHEDHSYDVPTNITVSDLTSVNPVIRWVDAAGQDEREAATFTRLTPTRPSTYEPDATSAEIAEGSWCRFSNLCLYTYSTPWTFTVTESRVVIGNVETIEPVTVFTDCDIRGHGWSVGYGNITTTFTRCRFVKDTFLFHNDGYGSQPTLVFDDCELCCRASIELELDNTTLAQINQYIQDLQPAPGHTGLLVIGDCDIDIGDQVTAAFVLAGHGFAFNDPQISSTNTVTTVYLSGQVGHGLGYDKGGIVNNHITAVATEDTDWVEISLAAVDAVLTLSYSILEYTTEVSISNGGGSHSNILQSSIDDILDQLITIGGNADHTLIITGLDYTQSKVDDLRALGHNVIT